MLRSWITLTLAVALLGLAAPALHAADMKLADLLTSKDTPATLTFKEMDATWQKFSLKKDLCDLLALGANADTGTMEDPEKEFYTKGKTLTIGTETYLIAYQQVEPLADVRVVNQMIRSSGEKPPTPKFITPDTQVQLCLLDQKKLGTILNISPANIAQKLAAAAQAKVVYEALKAKQNAEESRSNLLSLGQSLNSYIYRHKGMLPTFSDAVDLQAEVRGGYDFSYPYNSHESNTIEQPGTDKVNYGVNTLISGKKKVQIAFPGAMLVAFERVPAADGSRQALFLDGHVATISAADWAQVKKASRLPEGADQLPTPEATPETGSAVPTPTLTSAVATP
jgi:prepilin-type processing-associated H-X9-DG protein